MQDALAGGAKLDELPAGLGLAAVTGTLDAQGNTPDGAPAPIPGGAALRQAIDRAGLRAAPNDQPTLEDGPDHSFYAVSVDAVVPPDAAAAGPGARPRARRLAGRGQAPRAGRGGHRADDGVAGGATLRDAAAAAGLPVTRTPPVRRAAQQAGVPDELAGPLFAAEPDHATMAETPDRLHRRRPGRDRPARTRPPTRPRWTGCARRGPARSATTWR